MKKKRMPGSYSYKEWFLKMLLIMRLSLLLICWSLIQVSANTYSQNTKLDIKLENASIKELFKDIKKQSEFTFLYNVDDVEKLKSLDCDFSQSTVEEILDACFKGTDMTYKIKDKVVIIVPKEKQKSKVVKPEKSVVSKEKELSGIVLDSNKQPIPGATIVIKNATIGTITDLNGKFQISVPIESKVLVVSFVGFESQEVEIGSKTNFTFILKELSLGVDEVVVVGYGQQKKESVVGAITTAKGEDLQRTGGVTNLGQALTGQLAGVTTIQTTGQPGKEDPKIFIRGKSTWNGGQPYILVDGVERSMNDLDISEVASVSVLKDASATAVYGVKGANGVILITTKRGTKGKPVLNISANSTMKIPSRLVDKLDAYDTYLVKNSAIEREVALMEGMWQDYTPIDIISRYRNQENLKYPEAYPNVDWQKEMVKSFTMDHRVNLNISGGTDFAKYFSSLSYTREGDLLKIRDNGRGYTPGFGYDKFNFRTNLDLNLTKTTSLKFNLAGVYGVLKTQNQNVRIDNILSAQYALPANAFLPQYADGSWGRSQNTDTRMDNSAAILANQGYDKNISTDLTSDLGITQKLDFLAEGLSVSAKLSFDNRFESVKSIVETSSWATKYIDPAIEDMPANGNPDDYMILLPVAGTNQFDWVYEPWTLQDENANNSIGRLRRRLYYQGQINYANSFGEHDVAATGVFTREQLATGSEFQRYREDWVFRTTYNYSGRYFAEFNGAYNGSEKFGTDYRFAFFPSAAVGWTISNENFMKSTENWLDKLKFRFSYGFIGDDGGLSDRWLYNSIWSYGAYGGSMLFGETANNGNRSPYKIYREGTVGNPFIHWEKARKSNFGAEMAILNNTLSANFEYFQEDRTDILLSGEDRVLPVYFGTAPPTANVGRVKINGYELELRFNKIINGWHIWANGSFTHAVDEIQSKEEPQLMASHLKAEGFQIGQTKTIITDGFINTWDEIYATSPLSSNDQNRLPGDYSVLDFDADGVVDNSKDVAPYGFSSRPQNNYNMSLGADYKGFSVMLQFYGVNNVTRYVSFENFVSNIDIAYAQTLDHWWPDNSNGSYFLPRWKTKGSPSGQAFLYDGSYLRLKNAELAYTFSGEKLKNYGMSSLRIYLNGNNLLFFSKLPDDREQGGERFGAYPTSRRINLGFDIKF